MISQKKKKGFHRVIENQLFIFLNVCKQISIPNESDLTFAKIKEFYELGLAKPSFFTNIFMAGQRKENNNRVKFFDIINGQIYGTITEFNH